MKGYKHVQSQNKEQGGNTSLVLLTTLPYMSLRMNSRSNDEVYELTVILSESPGPKRPFIDSAPTSGGRCCDI